MKLLTTRDKRTDTLFPYPTLFRSLLDTAREIAAKVSVPLPVDVVVAKEFAESATATVKLIADVAEDDMILDIGPQTAANFAELLKSSKTILWNGPVGVRSEEHTSELQSLMRISYAVFCLKKKIKKY